MFPAAETEGSLPEYVWYLPAFLQWAPLMFFLLGRHIIFSYLIGSSEILWLRIVSFGSGISHPSTNLMLQCLKHASCWQFIGFFFLPCGHDRSDRHKFYI